MNPDQREFGPRWNHALQQVEYGWWPKPPVEKSKEADQ